LNTTTTLKLNSALLLERSSEGKDKEVKSMKGLPNMGNLLKKAQELQEKMTKLQEELGEKTVEASAGGGMVTVVANGKQEIVSITIDPEVVDSNDIEMLQDLVLAAVNDALFQAKRMISEEMSQLTGGVNIPGIISS
jgi:DNA-binding YbaB/EbfC family protein